MILTTERLFLRPWKVSDAENLYEYAKDPDVGPSAGWPAHKSVEESRSVIETALSGKECYAICLVGQEKPIGSIELILNGHTSLTDRDDECELGFWIGKPFWGRGLVLEAARAMLRHAFSDLGMHAVWCGYYDGNEKSRRVQEKLGFRHRFTRENVSVPALGETRVCHDGILTKEDWASRFPIRLLTEREIPPALFLAWEVFLKYEAPDYPQEGIDEFRHCLQDRAYLSGIRYYGAFDNGQMIGVLGVREETCHICFFFVKSGCQRLGIGTRLFHELEKDFPGRTVTVNASPYGLPFYRSLGFTAEGDERAVNGIRFTPMLFPEKKPVYNSLNCTNNKSQRTMLQDASSENE